MCHFVKRSPRVKERLMYFQLFSTFLHPRVCVLQMPIQLFFRYVFYPAFGPDLALQVKQAYLLLSLSRDSTITTVNFTGNTVWFKASVTQVGFRASFAYSTDGKSFQPIGNELKMKLGLNWTANRFALFNYNTNKNSLGGYVDFNWFYYGAPVNERLFQQKPSD